MKLFGLIDIIMDDELSDKIIEFRHPKTDKLILRIVNLQGLKEEDELESRPK